MLFTLTQKNNQLTLNHVAYQGKSFCLTTKFTLSVSLHNYGCMSQYSSCWAFLKQWKWTSQSPKPIQSKDSQNVGKQQQHFFHKFRSTTSKCINWC